MFLVFDTETTGLPKQYNAPLTDFDNWPRLVQLAWQLHDDKGKLVENHNLLVKPEGFIIPIDAQMVHGISTEHATKYGLPLQEVLDTFLQSAEKAKYFVGHNIGTVHIQRDQQLLAGMASHRHLHREDRRVLPTARRQGREVQTAQTERDPRDTLRLQVRFRTQRLCRRASHRKSVP